MNTDTIYQYKDKAFIYNILCLKASTFYSRIKNILTFPLMLISSVMAILNASFNPDEMRIYNIILNGCTAFLMNLMGAYQITEKASRFKSVSQKWSGLLHLIEDKINNNNLESDDVRDIVRIYDEILSQSDDIPQFLCDSVKKKFKNMHLPVILYEGTSPSSRPASEQHVHEVDGEIIHSI